MGVAIGYALVLVACTAGQCQITHVVTEDLFDTLQECRDARTAAQFGVIPQPDEKYECAPVERDMLTGGADDGDQ